MSVQIRGRQIMDSTVTAAKLVLTDSFNFGSGTVSVATPSSGTHAANKDYVDGLIQGLHPKESVRVLTKNNVDISAAPAAIDGVTMANKDRVCLTGQSTGTQDGIYKYNGSGSAMTRTDDADTFAKLQSAYFFVKEGTSADEGFVQTAELTSFASQNYVQFSSAGNIVAGNGLAKSGNTLSVNVDGSSLEIDSDALRVKAGGVSNAMLANSAITIAGASTALGGSISADTIAGQISSSTITNAQLANSSVSLGGVSVSLGGTNATPEFDLQDATGYPTSALVGSVANSQLANKAITIAGASGTELGGSITAAAILGASNTDALSEGSSNLYFSNARAQGAISVTDTAEMDFSYSSGAISAALKADSVALSKVSFAGNFETFTASGSNKEYTLTKTIKLNLVQGFAVAVNGLLMNYNASATGIDQYFVDNGGEAGKGRVKFGSNLNANDVVTIRYYA